MYRLLGFSDDAVTQKHENLRSSNHLYPDTLNNQSPMSQLVNTEFPTHFAPPTPT